MEASPFTVCILHLSFSFEQMMEGTLNCRASLTTSSKWEHLFIQIGHGRFLNDSNLH